jgi:hypothetical protein
VLRPSFVMMMIVATSSLVAGAPTASARPSPNRAVLCQVLPNGRAVTVTVAQRAAWALVRRGAWDGACGLQRAASIQGRVTDTLGRPAVGVCVQVFVDFPDGTGNVSQGVTTGAAGNYHVWIPFAGNAHVLFARANSISQYDPNPDATIDRCNGPFVEEWYDNAPYGPEGFQLSIPVAGGTRATGVNAVLARWGAITGKLTDHATGAPIAGALVTVAEDPDFCTYTGADGTYSVLVSPGSFRLDFNPSFSEGCENGTIPPPYFEEWYRDKPDAASANVVVVGDGQTISGIDGTLSRGGSISGTVTDAVSGAPLVFTSQVCITQLATSVSTCTLSGNDGVYSFAPLAAGTYVVQFTGDQYATEWYDNAPTQAAAKAITITSSTDQTGVNAALAPAP